MNCIRFCLLLFLLRFPLPLLGAAPDTMERPAKYERSMPDYNFKLQSISLSNNGQGYYSTQVGKMTLVGRATTSLQYQFEPYSQVTYQLEPSPHNEQFTFEPGVNLANFKLSWENKSFTLGRFIYQIRPQALFQPSNFLYTQDKFSFDPEDPVDAIFFRWQAAPFTEVHIIFDTLLKSLFRTHTKIENVNINLNFLGLDRADTLISGDISTKLKSITVETAFKLTLNEEDKGFFSFSAGMIYKIGSFSHRIEYYLNGLGAKTVAEYPIVEKTFHGQAPYSTYALSQHSIGSKLKYLTSTHTFVDLLGYGNLIDKSTTNRISFNYTNKNHKTAFGADFNTGKKTKGNLRLSEHGDLPGRFFFFYQYKR